PKPRAPTPDVGALASAVSPKPAASRLATDQRHLTGFVLAQVHLAVEDRLAVRALHVDQPSPRSERHAKLPAAVGGDRLLRPLPGSVDSCAPGTVADRCSLTPGWTGFV